MTKENLQAICEILQDRFGFDELDLVEFVMEYEKQTGQHIPAEWLPLFPGTMETVKLK